MVSTEGRVMNSVAVITGGASGFGRALSADCAARGMSVALLDLDGPLAVKEASVIAEAHGAEVIGVQVDVAESASLDAAARDVGERFGHADLVISNVGVQLFGALEMTTDDEWRWVLDVNVIGAARVTRSFLPLLRQANRGRVAFTSSSSVFDPASRMSMYQSSKFAVWGLAETLRLELAEEGIAVSVIFPSGMISRHLETSEAAQPAHLRRPIAHADDFPAMHESNPTMSTFLATPQEAARGVVDALLADAPYIITHGEFDAAIDKRALELHAASTSTTTKFQKGSER
jgi:NAD(P)-dependent dehydrogenase (short-subunit alcohol dehydrogenase family)